jgi:hypothetical protein
MAEQRAWLLAAQPMQSGWVGLAAVAYDTHVGCQGYALLTFDAHGQRTASERLATDNPAGATHAAATDFDVDPAAWRPAYAVLASEALPWAEVEQRMNPDRFERERRACLHDQYGGLFDEIAGDVGEDKAAAILPMIRTTSSLDELRAFVGDDAEAIWEAWWRYPEIDSSEKAVLADVQEHGWHALWIHGDDEGPEFTYSIGFYRTLGAPEVIVFGLRPELAHSMLWDAYRRCEQGDVLQAGTFYEDFIEGHAITFAAVSDDARATYFGFANWFYKGEFPALQLVWPSARDGSWPWESESISRIQPLLGPVPGI